MAISSWCGEREAIEPRSVGQGGGSAGRMIRIAWALIVVRALFAASLVLCASAFSGGQAKAQSADRFYAGKTLHFIVTYQPGGTYDLYSRLFATHASKHIPGNPPVVVEYMPDAGAAQRVRRHRIQGRDRLSRRPRGGSRHRARRSRFPRRLVDDAENHAQRVAAPRPRGGAASDPARAP